jgi:hypothetical protein
MADPADLEVARKTFADVAADLEDAALVACEAQSVPDLARARKACQRLLRLLNVSLKRLHRLQGGF